ncbi:diphthine synthase [Patescibacteria group bacterium]|nr:diphthine synthase [Patescibacteria group bacterium]
MLYLIGLGLNENSYNKETERIISEAKAVYLENYTVDFPYDLQDLENQLNLKGKIIQVDRGFVEQEMEKLFLESKDSDIVLLIYGSPLMATTHISLINEAKKSNVKTRVIHNASIFDAVSETGLQLYKFGKITSMPDFEASSYTEVIKENQSIQAHTLILVDIGLNFNVALEKLRKDCENNEVPLTKIVVCSRLGCKNSKVYYEDISNLKQKDLEKPFCFIIPGKLHFTEKEFLNEI